MLKNKTVILGVTGSIAAYKIAGLASMLKKNNCDVHVIMTKNATEIIQPLTFERLTGNKCCIETFDKNFQFDVEHISLATKADLFMVAPASADIIGKIANGIADDMLTTTIMACKAPKFIAPAMNTNMYENVIVQNNIKKLKEYGYNVINPASGYLACGAVGTGKMPEPQILFEYIVKELAFEKDFKGKKILVTAGPTCEAIDPVRYITNHSTGKMGYSIAKVCAMRGADVTLISGKTEIEKPMFVNCIDVISAEQMFEKVKENVGLNDIIIKAAAVADYTPSIVYDEKIKKKSNDMSIQLKRTKDILKYIGKNKKENQFICGFSMETEKLIENSKEKLIKKNIDMIVANSLKIEGAGFAADTNVVTIITNNNIINLPKLSKFDTANKILDIIKQNMTKKQL